MLLLFISALLFIFLAYVLGAYFSSIVERLTKQIDQQASHLLTFFLGFIVLGTYFNTWSLFWKVDFLSILPLAIISIFLFRKRRDTTSIKMVEASLICIRQKMHALSNHSCFLSSFPVYNHSPATWR